MEPQPALGLEDLQDRGVDAGFGNLPAPDGALDLVDGHERVGGQKQDIGPGRERGHGRAAAPVAAGDPGHFQGVGDDQSLKPQFSAQGVGKHPGGKGGGNPRVSRYSGDRDMSRHDGVHPRRDGALEGDEFQRAQPPGIRPDHRQAEVGIDRRVPMPGKMLRRGQHPPLARPADESGAQAGDGFQVLPERPDVDDGVFGIAVDVHHGSEDPVHPQGARLAGRDAALPVGQGFVPRRAERHRPGEGGRIRNPESRPTLEIGGDQQRQPGHALQFVQQDGRFVDMAREQDHPSDVVLPDLRRNLQEFGAPAVEERSRDPDLHQLRDLVPEGEPGERPLRPGVLRGALEGGGCEPEPEQEDHRAGEKRW